MPIQKYAVLSLLAAGIASCDYPTTPRESDRPAIRANEQNGAATYEVKRHTTANFVVEPEGATINGPVVAVATPAGAATEAHTLTTMSVTCHKRGTGVFSVDLKGPDNTVSTFTLTIKCVDRISANTTQPLNLTERFEGEGRVVIGMATDPSTLAEQVNIAENLASTFLPLSFTNRVGGSGALASGDIGVKCLEEGEGTLFVTFESGSDDFDLTCSVGHEQGGGS